MGAAKDFQITFVATMRVETWAHYHLALDNIVFSPDCAAVASINQAPADMSTPQGSKAVFVCGVKGDPTPTVTWYNKIGAALGSANFSADGGRIWQDAKNSLVFNSTKAGDAGTYTCNATNSLGSKTASATLVILNVSRQLPTGTLPHRDFTSYQIFSI